MNLLHRLLGRRPPVSDLRELADFVDMQSAFLVQKGIYEYSRARAGHYSKVLFGEPEFRRVVENSRWRAYPLGLAMVGEVVVGVVDQHAEQEREMVLSAVAELVLSVFDRYPVPAVLDDDAWRKARSDLAKRLDLIGLHRPKQAMDIPEPLAKSYFALMPIHENLRGQDYPTLKNYLRVTLCNIYDELTKRIDAQAVADQLRARHS
jgi:hypothetical protein